MESLKNAWAALDCYYDEMSIASRLALYAGVAGTVVVLFFSAIV